MLVEKRMTRNPQTITPEDYLAGALVKMHKGGFRRLPVVKDGKLIGIITDRDLREHAGLYSIFTLYDERFRRGAVDEFTRL